MHSFLRTTYYVLRTLSRRAGFSFIELLLVMGITALIGGFLIAGFTSSRDTKALSATAEHMAALIREAQSRSVGQASSLSWGVRFDNGYGSSPFYSLFSGSFSTSTRESYSPLPGSLRYATTSIASGSYVDITFAQLSGFATGSTSVKIYLANDPSASTTITVDSSGAVSY